MFPNKATIVNGTEIKPILIFITKDWRYAELLMLPAMSIGATDLISWQSIVDGQQPENEDILVPDLPDSRHKLKLFFRELCRLNIRTASLVSSEPMPQSIIRQYGRYIREMQFTGAVMTDAEYSEKRVGILKAAPSVIEYLKQRPLDIQYR